MVNSFASSVRSSTVPNDFPLALDLVTCHFAKGDPCFLARITGSVVASTKVDSMIGQKQVIVEPLRVNEKTKGDLVGTGRSFISVDVVGAGEGEVVLIVQGSSARSRTRPRSCPLTAPSSGSSTRSRSGIRRSSRTTSDESCQSLVISGESQSPGLQPWAFSRKEACDMDDRWNTTSVAETHGDSIRGQVRILTIILLALVMGRSSLGSGDLRPHAWNQPSTVS